MNSKKEMLEHLDAVIGLISAEYEDATAVNRNKLFSVQRELVSLRVKVEKYRPAIDFKPVPDPHEYRNAELDRQNIQLGEE
jgi:hypothetical protein